MDLFRNLFWAAETNHTCLAIVDIVVLLLFVAVAGAVKHTRSRYL